MLTIFYSPHATSTDNEIGQASGHANVPLSVLGHQQAQELGQHYAAEKLDAIFCSDLQRASATAEIAFANRSIPILRDNRLRECDYGEMTQHPIAEVEKSFMQHIDTPFVGGESILTVVQRVGAFLRAIFEEYNEKTILVIGHRATRYGLIYWCSNASLEEIVASPWEWLDIPIWRYELHELHLKRMVSSTDKGQIEMN
jgi:broad specificity phosphatase PhoE